MLIIKKNNDADLEDGHFDPMFLQPTRAFGLWPEETLIEVSPLLKTHDLKMYAAKGLGGKIILFFQ